MTVTWPTGHWPPLPHVLLSGALGLKAVTCFPKAASCLPQGLSTCCVPRPRALFFQSFGQLTPLTSSESLPQRGGA